MSNIKNPSLLLRHYKKVERLTYKELSDKVIHFLIHKYRNTKAIKCFESVSRYAKEITPISPEYVYPLADSIGVNRDVFLDAVVATIMKKTARKYSSELTRISKLSKTDNREEMQRILDRYSPVVAFSYLFRHYRLLPVHVIQDVKMLSSAPLYKTISGKQRVTPRMSIVLGRYFNLDDGYLLKKQYLYEIQIKRVYGERTYK